MYIKSEGRAIFWNMHPVIKLIRPFCFHQKNCPQSLSPLALGLYVHVSNKTKYHKIMRQKGSFWNWCQIMGTIKALKYCQNLYQVVVCPCPGAIYMFEIVKKCKISLRAQDQLSGERCRTAGPLVTNVQLERNGKKVNESENDGKSTLENLLSQKIFDVPTYDFKTIK